MIGILLLIFYLLCIVVVVSIVGNLYAIYASVVFNFSLYSIYIYLHEMSEGPT